ncbi:MAG: hypothetical protein WDW38_007605 [Sanguina aurantia]
MNTLTALLGAMHDRSPGVAALPPQHSLDHTSPKLVIYLYGDPLAAVASHYRRDHAYHQALKTSGHLWMKPTDFPATFEEYVSRGEDLFGLIKHYEAWLTSPTNYPILFLRYEHMFREEVANQLFCHICSSTGCSADPAALASAFTFLSRQRSCQVSAHMSPLYEQLIQHMDTLPSIFIR